jgi:hypothetical protein
MSKYRVTWISPKKGVKGKEFDNGQKAVDFGFWMVSKGYEGVIVKNKDSGKVIGTPGFRRKRKVFE